MIFILDKIEMKKAENQEEVYEEYMERQALYFGVRGYDEKFTATKEEGFPCESFNYPSFRLTSLSSIYS